MLADQSESIYCVVDNRVLVLGIDQRYRHYMPELEAAFLLPHLEVIAEKLNLKEKEVPVEGYYSEDPKLRRYFKLMRALQEQDDSSLPVVEALPEFHEILRVVGSPIFGAPRRGKTLLPQGRDPLSQALQETPIQQWNADTLTRTAYQIVMDTDDISLVGLAARCQDPIAITALRESVILYAAKELGSLPRKYEYIWKVDPEFAEIANRFIDEFNRLLPKDSILSHGIDTAEPQNAWSFYSGYAFNALLGRCANLGFDNSMPTQYYHWAITQQKEEPALDEFWSTELWTTERYRSEHKTPGRNFFEGSVQ